MNHNRSQLCSTNTDMTPTTWHGNFQKNGGSNVILFFSVSMCVSVMLSFYALDIFYYTLIHFKILVITVLPHLKCSQNCIFSPGGSLKYSERVHKVLDPKYCKKKKTLRERSVGHLSGACPGRVHVQYVSDTSMLLPAECRCYIGSQILLCRKRERSARWKTIAIVWLGMSVSTFSHNQQRGYISFYILIWSFIAVRIS